MKLFIWYDSEQTFQLETSTIAINFKMIPKISFKFGENDILNLQNYEIGENIFETCNYCYFYHGKLTTSEIFFGFVFLRLVFINKNCHLTSTICCFSDELVNSIAKCHRIDNTHL